MQLTIREPGSAITFYRLPDGFDRSLTTFNKSSRKCNLYACHDHFCHKHGFIVRSKHNLSQYLSCIC